jgi:hypothetical protein
MNRLVELSGYSISSAIQVKRLFASSGCPIVSAGRIKGMSKLFGCPKQEAIRTKSLSDSAVCLSIVESNDSSSGPLQYKSPEWDQPVSESTQPAQVKLSLAQPQLRLLTQCSRYTLRNSVPDPERVLCECRFDSIIIYRDFHIKSTLSIHPIRLVILAL